MTRKEKFMLLMAVAGYTVIVMFLLQRMFPCS